MNIFQAYKDYPLPITFCLDIPYLSVHSLVFSIDGLIYYNSLKKCLRPLSLMWLFRIYSISYVNHDFISYVSKPQRLYVFYNNMINFKILKIIKETMLKDLIHF